MAYVWLAGAAIAVLLVAFSFWPRPVRCWVLLVSGGMTMLGDIPAALADLYVFRPGFLPDRRDNYVGCLSAEWLFVPAYLVFLTLAPARYRPLAGALGASISTLIEILFLRLDVYDQHHWRTWVSTILFALVGWGLGRAANALEQQGYTRLHRAALVAGGLLWLLNLWGLVIDAILRLEGSHLGLLRNLESDRLVSFSLLVYIPSVVAAFMIIWRGRGRQVTAWVAYGAGLAGWIYLLQSLAVMRTRPPWNPILDGVLGAALAACVGWLDQWLGEDLPAQDGVVTA